MYSRANRISEVDALVSLVGFAFDPVAIQIGKPTVDVVDTSRI